MDSSDTCWRAESVFLNERATSGEFLSLKMHLAQVFVKV